jgi:Rrf2 family protein
MLTIWLPDNIGSHMGSISKDQFMITKKTFYAIKAMVFLARHQFQPAYSLEIAVAENIPRHFVEKILTDLRNAGYLSVTRGHLGGYALLLHPKEITVAGILQVMQGAIISSPCINLNINCDECQHKSFCGISETIIQINNMFLQKLTAINLEILMTYPEKTTWMSERYLYEELRTSFGVNSFNE